MGKMRKAYKTCIQVSEQKRTVRRYRHTWEDNIEMSHKDLKGVDVIHRAQDREWFRAF
jgi:hypothetical protein